MKIKLFFSIFFTAIFLITLSGLAAADANLDISMSPTTINATHNSAASGSFVLNNTNTSTTINNINCTISIGTWSYSCSPSTSLTANNTQTVSFTVSVPQYTLPGTYSGTINAAGNLSGQTASDSQTFYIVVAQSASLGISWPSSPSNLYQGQNKTITFNISNTGNIAQTVTASLDLSGLNLTSLNETFSLNSGGSSATRSFNLNTAEETNIGQHTLQLQASGTGALNSSASSSQTFTVYYPCCENLTGSTTPIRLEEIKNEDDIEDEDFYPLDIIKIELKVSNYDDDEDYYVIAEAVLVYKNDEVDDSDVKEKFKIEEDDTETFKLSMTIPADVKEGTHYLYVQVYSDDDDDNCMQEAIRLNIKKRTREVIPAEITYPSSVSCGETFSFSGKIANTGEKDEDKVDFQLKAFDSTYGDGVDDLDWGDLSSLFDFDIKVPENETSGSKKLLFTIYYDYDEDDKTFDDSESFPYYVTVICTEEDFTLTTETSTAILNKESEVKVLIKNPGTSAVTYSFSATADWAEIKSVSPESLTLNSGEKQYVTIKLTPDKDTGLGTHSLSFSVSYDSETETTSVPVNVQRISETANPFEKIAFQFQYNTVWAVIDTVLIIAIIAIIILIIIGQKQAQPGKAASSGILSSFKSLVQPRHKQKKK